MVNSFQMVMSLLNNSFCGLNQHKFIILHLFKLKIQHGSCGPRSRCWRGCTPFWGSREENPFPCLFWPLEAAIFLRVESWVHWSLLPPLPLLRTLVITLSPWNSQGSSPYLKVDWLAILILHPNWFLGARSPSRLTGSRDSGVDGCGDLFSCHRYCHRI